MFYKESLSFLDSLPFFNKKNYLTNKVNLNILFIFNTITFFYH